MKLHDEIVLAFHTYLKEHELFEDNGIKTSANRARKALHDLHLLTRERRKQIQEKKNEM
jgi:hypothetical protein